MMSPGLTVLAAALFASIGYCGTLTVKRCSDIECRVDCESKTYEVHDFDWKCHSNGKIGYKHTCLQHWPANLYRLEQYESTNCNSHLYSHFISGICYSEPFGSFMYECSPEDIAYKSESIASSDDSAVEWQYLIGFAVVFLVFAAGVCGGYCVYKKRLAKYDSQAN